MAGDWIKVRTNLGGDPAVKSIARELRETAHSVVGRLHALWSWADQHTDDGALDFSVLTDIDDIVEKRGFAAQMVRVGWLIDRGADGVCIPNWERHNGRSAKKRCLDSEAQRRKRETHTDINRTMSENHSDKKRQTPDQRREEKSNTPTVPASGDERDDEFEIFWAAYPRKVNKPRALRAWRATAAHRPGAGQILAAIEAFVDSSDWQRDDGAFIPHPASWLTGHRWAEVLPESEGQNSQKKEKGPAAPAEGEWRDALKFLREDRPDLIGDLDIATVRSWSQLGADLQSAIVTLIAAAEQEEAA